MNRYGTRAQAYWREFLPAGYAAIEDPTGFFTRLGEEVRARVRAMSGVALEWEIKRIGVAA